MVWGRCSGVRFREAAHVRLCSVSDDVGGVECEDHGRCSLVQWNRRTQSRSRDRSGGPTLLRSGSVGRAARIPPPVTGSGPCFPTVSVICLLF
ncbi:hypothetical protein Nepgr_016732 [Nepenthes gracilis]|uniref:Uncharacterized protein n=1 Tax=Nepenthes gracilis TaxID=150966 RepID=A0AAD3SQU0_NEPGR|nr:hypothetical protein Nepgr_016732 [Nepenthes gracilis]